MKFQPNKTNLLFPGIIWNLVTDQHIIGGLNNTLDNINLNHLTTQMPCSAHTPSLSILVLIVVNVIYVLLLSVTYLVLSDVYTKTVFMSDALCIVVFQF